MRFKRWTWLLLMLPFATLAIAACGRGASEEDAVRDAVREAVAAFNNKDFDKLADRLTANFYGFEPTAEALEGLLADSATRIEDLQLVSVTVEGQEATAEITRTQNGEAARETILLVKVGSRWRLDRSVESIIESGDEDQPGETPRLPPEEEPPLPKLTADDLPSLVLGAEEVGDVYPGIVLIEGVFGVSESDILCKQFLTERCGLVLAPRQRYVRPQQGASDDRTEVPGGGGGRGQQ